MTINGLSPIFVLYITIYLPYCSCSQSKCIIIAKHKHQFPKFSLLIFLELRQSMLYSTTGPEVAGGHLSPYRKQTRKSLGTPFTLPTTLFQLSDCTIPAMDCLASHIPPSLRTLLEAYAPPGSAEYAPHIGVAFTSLVAVYVGYLYLQSWREAAVVFNVPIPSEVRKSGSIKTWDEVQGQQKMVLQDQARGVS